LHTRLTAQAARQALGNSQHIVYEPVLLPRHIDAVTVLFAQKADLIGGF